MAFSPAKKEIVSGNAQNYRLHGWLLGFMDSRDPPTRPSCGQKLLTSLWIKCDGSTEREKSARLRRARARGCASLCERWKHEEAVEGAGFFKGLLAGCSGDRRDAFDDAAAGMRGESPCLRRHRTPSLSQEVATSCSSRALHRPPEAFWQCEEHIQYLRSTEGSPNRRTHRMRVQCYIERATMSPEV